MSDYDDVDARPKKKGGIPTWLWLGCGGGCLGLLLIGAIFAWMGKGMVENMTDTERHWPELQKVLPFEERPDDLEMLMGMKIPFTGMKQYLLMDQVEGRQATVYVMSKNVDEMIDELMAAKPRGTIAGLGNMKDAESVDFTIQGEVVPSMTFTGIKGQDFGPEEGRMGSGVRVNLHDAGLEGVLVELRSIGSEEPWTELEVEEFFSRFRLW